VNPFCKDLAVDCNTYWKNRIGFAFIDFLEDTNIYVNGKLEKGHKAIPWILILALLIALVHKTRAESHNYDRGESVDLFGISILPIIANSFHKQVPRYVTAFLIVIFSFTTTAGCFPLLTGGGEGESGTPIWLLGVGGVPVDTPSVGNGASSGGLGGGSTGSGSTRINGMYFFHPDHLGSITMITDGNGNVLAGGERGGKSHITYKPYGEILRTDSYGPDITKFKYTGQEEDRESGLYYYKARYYDASLGRFASNDGMSFPDKPQGMNRMMYVEGNPMKWKDNSGNKISKALTWGIMGALAAPQYGMSAEQGFFAGVEIGRGKERQDRSRRLENRAGYVNLGKFWDTTFGKDGFAGWTPNNFYSVRKINKYVYNINRKYENTSRGEKREMLDLYLNSPLCNVQFGRQNCVNAWILNRGFKRQEEDRHYYKLGNPQEGIFAFKLRPTNEDPSRVENDSATVICVNYFMGSSSGGYFNREQDFVDSYATLYASSLSCGFTNFNNPSYLGYNEN